MRYTHYWSNGIQVAFKPEDFEQMGLKFMSVGMPMLEAYQLINKLNKKYNQKFWL